MTDREAMQQALEHICAAKLCSINSMSSREEMIRLMDKAITALRARIAQPEPARLAPGPREAELLAALQAVLTGWDEWANRGQIEAAIENARRLVDACPVPNIEESPHCPHGAPIGECQACDRAADFAHDAAREARIFGR